MAFIPLALCQVSHSLCPPFLLLSFMFISFTSLLKPDVSVLDSAVFMSFSLSLLSSLSPPFLTQLLPLSPLHLLLTPLLLAAPIRLFLLPVAMTLASCSSVRLVLRDETKELSLALFI